MRLIENIENIENSSHLCTEISKICCNGPAEDLLVSCLDTVKICHIIVPIYYTEVIISEKNLCNAVDKTCLDINTL